MKLPTMAEVQAARKGPILKGQSRLEKLVQARPLATVDDRAFKKEVWTRDHKRCRWCGRKVIKTIERIPERGEVHHLHGRAGDLLHEAKCALLLCLEHHEKVTGRVNERWLVIGTKFWRLNGTRVIDARQTVTFERAV